MAILPASFTDRRRHQGELDRVGGRRLSGRETLGSNVQVDAVVVGRPATALLVEALAYADSLCVPVRDGKLLSVSHVFRASSWADAAAIARRSPRCVVIADDGQTLPGSPLWDGRGNDVSVLTADSVFEHSCRDARHVPHSINRSFNILRICRVRTEKLASQLKRAVPSRRFKPSARVPA